MKLYTNVERIGTELGVRGMSDEGGLSDPIASSEIDSMHYVGRRMTSTDCKGCVSSGAVYCAGDGFFGNPSVCRSGPFDGFFGSCDDVSFGAAPLSSGPDCAFNTRYGEVVLAGGHHNSRHCDDRHLHLLLLCKETDKVGWGRQSRTTERDESAPVGNDPGSDGQANSNRGGSSGRRSIWDRIFHAIAVARAGNCEYGSRVSSNQWMKRKR